LQNGKKIDRACFFGRLCAAAGALCRGTLLAANKEPENEHGKNFRLLEHPRHLRKWNDKRSHKVVFLANCMTNMNARMHNCVDFFASSADPLVRFCLDNQLGMAVMPCPELLVTGLGRDRDEPEKDYLKSVLEEPLARERIRKLAEQVVFQMKEYRFQGFEMIALIGNDNSPSCGVDLTSFADPNKRFGPGQGVFIQELQKLMAEEGIELPMKGVVKDALVEDTVAWLKEQL
jgi:predicted secreted protein